MASHGQALLPCAPREPEAAILKGVLHALNLMPGCIAWRNNQGLFKTRYGGTVRAGVGGKGAADIFALVTVGSSAVVVFIEVKAADGTLEPHQKEWLEEMARRGAVSGVARTVDEAVALVELARFTREVA